MTRVVVFKFHIISFPSQILFGISKYIWSISSLSKHSNAHLVLELWRTTRNQHQLIQPPSLQPQSDSKDNSTKSQVAARSTGIPEEQKQESGTGVEGELKAKSKICGDSISDMRENKANWRWREGDEKVKVVNLLSNIPNINIFNIRKMSICQLITINTVYFIYPIFQQYPKNTKFHKIRIFDIYTKITKLHILPK